MSAARISLHARGGQEWLVRAQLDHAGEIGLGEVVVRLPGRPSEPPHTILAETRAWLALANGKRAAGAHADAIDCARSGLAVLGDEYEQARMADDTRLKLFAAEERRAAGHIADAATVTVRMLEVRVALYLEKYASDIVR